MRFGMYIATTIGLVKTARVLRGTRSGSLSKLSRYLAVGYDEAVLLARPFVRFGILSEPDAVGFRRLNNDPISRSLLFAMALGGKDLRRHVEPSWQEILSYADLDRVAAACKWLGPDEFLQGPFDRFLDLAGAADVPARARARIMERARHSVERQSAALRDRNGLPSNFVALARFRVATKFTGSTDQNYLLDVFDGRADHNRVGIGILK